jgi:hypothetical protein
VRHHDHVPAVGCAQARNAVGGAVRVEELRLPHHALNGSVAVAPHKLPAIGAAMDSPSLGILSSLGLVAAIPRSGLSGGKNGLSQTQGLRLPHPEKDDPRRGQPGGKSE